MDYFEGIVNIWYWWVAQFDLEIMSIKRKFNNGKNKDDMEKLVRLLGTIGIS